MPRHGERDGSKERFWRRMVRQWRRSRLSIRDFCGQHGLAEPSFYAWRRTIAQRDEHTSKPRLRGHVHTDRQPGRVNHPSHGHGRRDHPPAFIPVRVVSAAPVALSFLEVVLSQGRVVRVPPGFDAATLRHLLAVLEGPSC